VQVQQPHLHGDGSLLCVRDDTGWLNAWCGDRPVLDEPHEHAGPTWGPRQRSVAVSPDERSVAIARNEDGFGRLVVVDRVTGAVHQVARAVHGQLHWRGRWLVALRTGARTPTQVVAYDTTAPDPTTWERRVLAVGPIGGWEDDPALVEPTPLTATAPDGAVLPARLYSPAVPQARGLICWVHGGPTDQWQVTFLPRIAYWVSRGMHVLVPDPRGSTGHGRAHQQALRGGWGVLDVDDTAALVRAAQAHTGITPTGTVAMGGSAGGLTALGLGVRHPRLLAGIAVAYPVSDIAALDDVTHRYEAHYNDTLIGPRRDPAARRARVAHSPLTVAPCLARVPLLVQHGDADPVVPVEQSRRLARAVAAAGGDVELVIHPGEGHGFRRPEVQVDEQRRVEAFVERCLSPARPPR
jgi:dipeptidyl aminopeptidase/acylaminoacyl peptidase